MKFVRAIVELLILIFLIMVAVQNYNVISQKFTFRLDLGFLGAWQIGPISVGLLFLIGLLIGGCFVGIYGLFEFLKLRGKYQEAVRRSSYEEKKTSSYSEPVLSAQPVEDEES